MLTFNLKVSSKNDSFFSVMHHRKTDFFVWVLTLYQFLFLFLGQQSILDAIRSFGIYHDLSLNGLRGMIYSLFSFHFSKFLFRPIILFRSPIRAKALLLQPPDCLLALRPILSCNF